ncbi:oligosaccharide flippase family protein [Xenorhabdus bovienii]|uniref:oligosaccharide flippase family protein n=1 Tax=Xenorhabdus bovienii TaxID=40576 RepID=UPI002157EA4B|nr:oligosaccharide flippase family protein [Xenorhabdus bovienii]
MNIKKEILSNIISLSSINIMGMLIPIITMPILARALGSDLYGQYLLFMTILIFGHTIIDYGVQYTGVRDVAQNRKNSILIKEYYAGYQTVRWILGLSYILIITLYSSLFMNNDITYWIFIAGIPYFLGYILTSSWFFQAIGKTKFLMYSSFVARIVNLIVIISIAATPESITILVISATWPVLICGLILFWRLKKNYNVSLLGFSKIKKYFENGLNTFIGILAPNLYNAIPIIIMGSIAAPHEFAKFSVATKICEIITTFQDVIAKSIYPALSMNNRNHLNKIILINILVSLPIFMVIYFLGDYILEMFLGHNFSDNTYLKIISIGMVFVGIANAYGQGFFLPKGLDIIYRTISIRVSILSSVISIILIYNYQILGGAIAITIARLLFVIDYHLVYKKLGHTL